MFWMHCSGQRIKFQTLLRVQEDFFSVSSNLPVNSFEVGVAAIVIHDFLSKKKWNENEARKFILCSQNFHFVFCPC